MQYQCDTLEKYIHFFIFNFLAAFITGTSPSPPSPPTFLFSAPSLTSLLSSHVQNNSPLLLCPISSILVTSDAAVSVFKSAACSFTSYIAELVSLPFCKTFAFTVTLLLHITPFFTLPALPSTPLHHTFLSYSLLIKTEYGFREHELIKSA